MIFFRGESTKTRHRGHHQKKVVWYDVCWESWLNKSLIYKGLAKSYRGQRTLMVHSGPWVHYRSAPDDFHGGDLKEEHVSSSKLISYMQLVFFFSIMQLVSFGFSLRESMDSMTTISSTRFVSKGSRADRCSIIGCLRQWWP